MGENVVRAHCENSFPRKSWRRFYDKMCRSLCHIQIMLKRDFSGGDWLPDVLPLFYRQHPCE